MKVRVLCYERDFGGFAGMENIVKVGRDNIEEMYKTLAGWSRALPEREYFGGSFTGIVEINDFGICH